MEWESRPRPPSTPTSESSQSTSGTSSSRDKIPPYKQLTPSPVVSALSKFSDDDLFRKGGDELLRMLRRVESDYKGLLSEHGNIVKDVNRRFQIFVLEARGLKEINQKLQDDNQELRDLCCFLDDDRQRSRKLAREWQRFGRYTASVMHSEVAAYQEKLRQLEDRQAELLSDNMELKELCLFLDHERSQLSGDRDDGDGSSNGTVPGQEDLVQSHGDSDSQATPTPTPTPSQQPTEHSSYVRQLELKIQRLEEEKKQLAQRVERNGGDGYHPADQDGTSRSITRQDTDHVQPGHVNDSRHGSSTPGRDRTTPTPTFAMNKPEAVVHAMKVLQVHEQLERPHDAVGTNNLGDTEKAIVREMCNVVWRKLGDVGEYPPHNTGGPPAGNSHHQSTPNIPYRPQSATGNPLPSGGHPGPPGPSRSQPSSLSMPGSPTGPVYHDSHTNPHSAPTTPGIAAGDMSRSVAPSAHARSYSGERRSQLPQGPKFGAGPSSPPGAGRREEYGQGERGGGMYSHGGGRDNMPGKDTMVGRDSGPRQVMRGREIPPDPKGSKGTQGPLYSQPVMNPSPHTTERPRHMQPPPYSSAKSMPSASQALGSGQHPSQYAPPSSSAHAQPQPHHQQPPSSSRQLPQQAPPRYQQRVHPLHPNQGPPSSHGHGMPRATSASATYYVSHPTPQAKSHSASALPTYRQPASSASSPGGGFVYSQRPGGGGGGPQSQFRPFPGGGEQGPRSGGDPGRTEWKQTYLDD